MPFKEGNNLGKGRPKGAKNVKTDQWDNMGEYLITQGAAKYINILKQTKGKEYLERFEKILEYFKPKQARTLFGDEDGKGGMVVNIISYGNGDNATPQVRS